MIQLTVTDTLQNFTNDYVFQTQEDMTTALHLLFDFADYGEESIKNKVLQPANLITILKEKGRI